MPPSVRGIINDGVGGYGATGAVRYYEGQEGVQHPLLVNISSLYDVALFGSVQSAV